MHSLMRKLGTTGFLSFPLERGGDGLGFGFKLLEKKQQEVGFVAERIADVKRSKLIICKCKKKENPDILISGSIGSSTSSITHSAEHLLPASAKEVLFIGEDGEGANIFLSPISHIQPQYLSSQNWTRARELFVFLSRRELHLLGMALSLAQWQNSISFCSSCGHPIPAAAFSSHSCKCKNCSQMFFPTVGSAVIVAVLDGNGKVLLCQNKKRPYNSVGKTLHTVLAGFSALGESLEETAYREVREESNVRLSALTYAGSQPWPFPSPMMMSCYYGVAESSSHLQPEEKELLSVQWVTKEAVLSAFAEEHPDFVLPPWYTSSHTLLRAWVDGVVSDDEKKLESFTSESNKYLKIEYKKSSVLLTFFYSEDFIKRQLSTMQTPMGCMSTCPSEHLKVSQIALPPSFTHKPYEPLLQDLTCVFQHDEADLQCSALSGGSSHSPLSPSCGLSDTSTLSFRSTNSPCNQNRLQSPTVDLDERTLFASRSVERNFDDELSLPSKRKSDNYFSTLHCSSFHPRTTASPFFPDSSSSFLSSPESISVKVKVQLRYGKHMFIIPELKALSSTSDPSTLRKHYFVVEGDRGEDIGTVEEIVEVYPSSDNKNKDCGCKKVLRAATDQDLLKFKRLKKEEEEAVDVCCRMIAEVGLEDITVLGALYQFDKKKLTFQYTSSTIVDFTQLTRLLHQVYKCRIWMDQLNRYSVSLKTKKNCSSDSTTDQPPIWVKATTLRKYRK